MAKKRAGFKESIAAYDGVMSSIKARNFAPIYLLMGDENYFIDNVCEALATTILSEAEQSFNQITLYGRDTEPDAIIGNARQVPMMGGHSVIIVKEAQQMRGIEKLSQYTTSPTSSTILILCHKDKSVDKRSTLYKSCLQNGVVMESIKPRDYEMSSWITGFMSSKGVVLTPKAQSMLLDNLGADISKISGEIDKLLIALPAGTQQITDDHIETYIGISKEFNNFELCNAITARNLKRALYIAEHFGHNPKAYPLLLTVMVLFNQFKQLFLMNYMRWQAKYQAVPFPSDMDLMRILKIANPYAVSELKQACANWPNKSVFTILGLMREYDAKSKGIGNGGASEGDLLKELILKIFAA
ncbi:MAG: DNA polymerase III subunit delta [Rikenellaceae bacterium]